MTNNIIDFFKASNEIWAKQNKEGLSLFYDTTLSLTILKLQCINVSGEDALKSFDILYSIDDICKAIDKANNFILDNYDYNDINTITSLPDELSKLAVEYLLEKKSITLNDLKKINEKL